MKLRIQGVKESRIQEVVGLAAILFDNILSHIPKFGLVLDAPRFVKRKEPDCPAIILFRYSDCETSGFPRTTMSTRRSPQFRSLGLTDVQRRIARERVPTNAERRTLNAERLPTRRTGPFGR